VGFDGLLGGSDEDQQFASPSWCGLQTDEPPDQTAFKFPNL
jgi:hypothetical protein